MNAAAESPPLADNDWHSPTELSPRVRRAPYTIREHLRSGALHGHLVDGRWQVIGLVGDAWRQGLDELAQRRICGCRAVASVATTRGRSRRP